MEIEPTVEIMEDYLISLQAGREDTILPAEREETRIATILIIVTIIIVEVTM